MGDHIKRFVGSLLASEFLFAQGLIKLPENANAGLSTCCGL